MERLKIAFVIKALAPPGGGAERILAACSSELARRGHDVTVVTSDQPGSSTYYPVDESVALSQLGIGDSSVSSRPADFFRRIPAFRKILLKLRPDIVVAFMHPSYLPVGIALLGTQIPIIASEHTAAKHYRGRPLQRILLQLTPFICQKITVVSKAVRESFGPWLRRHMIVIANPVTISSDISKKRPNENSLKTILAVGRLGPEKQHGLLIDAFSSIAPDFPGWRLRIIGDGELRSTLEARIRELNMSDSINLAGMRSDVSSEYAAAEIFAIPSAYESFGLVAAEALLHGLPAVGFADCQGVNELIVDGTNGRLVSGSDKAQSLATALSELMDNESERQRLSESSREWIREKFGIENTVNQWESVFSVVTEQRS